MTFTEKVANPWSGQFRLFLEKCVTLSEPFLDQKQVLGCLKGNILTFLTVWLIVSQADYVDLGESGLY